MLDDNRIQPIEAVSPPELDRQNKIEHIFHMQTHRLRRVIGSAYKMTEWRNLLLNEEYRNQQNT